MPLHVTDWVNNMNLWVFLSKKDVAQLKKNQNWSARQCNSPLVYGCSCSRNRNMTPLNPPRTQTKGSAVLWPVSLLTFPNSIPNFPTSHCYLLTYLCFIFVQPCLFPICIFLLTLQSLHPHDLIFHSNLSLVLLYPLCIHSHVLSPGSLHWPQPLSRSYFIV